MSVYLTRTDPGQNMARFYRVDVQPDLFGGWSFIREWGRIGSAGQVMVQSFATESDAELARGKAHLAKARRGYETSGRYS